eukprot:CAMPEP_0172560836 /NCGR_PEP_ID=MMETSP1067-20121228/90397_1 /TAXON_ID=265564 ORGANISM="Thalassiosira punctigera, Strain Tpunct2005C2" /NCGR_SAMPLE_ID=MMETSP1067 /ASSEMBLY_ACC=CAM_ASM_000444 /LENGTH=771 /DNA_ID=CAMNT_0013350723 /DNA_START=196 /DNA_END=2511 /DNA_ORIENTATION=+
MAALPPRVQKTTFIFRTNVRKSQLESSRCGVLHVFRSSAPSGSREEHAFAWVENYELGVEATCAHLERYGFPRDRAQFIPFSSEAAWISKYPHAFPHVRCSVTGEVTGFPLWSHQAQSELEVPPEVLRAAHSAADVVAEGIKDGRTDPDNATNELPAKRKNAAGGGRLADTVLTNGERRELHNEIYNYFKWLSDRVADLETSEAGRRAVKKADLPAAALRSIVLKLEAAFKIIGQKKVAAGEKKMAEAIKKIEANVEVVDDDDDNAAMPLLEESLAREMAGLAAAEEEAKRRAKKIKLESSDRRKSTGESLDFDLMFEKLLVYKEEHGHPNVPVKYQKDIQLGSWVSGLRTKKKHYDNNSDAMEMDEEGWSLDKEEEGGDDNDNGDNGDNDNASKNNTGASQRYLNPERIRRLESIGFLWSMSKPKAKPRSWDERLEELKRWKEEHGTFKVPRAESLGEWLHNQRTLYGKRDSKFMANKAPRMEEIGYHFNVKENTSVSWEDRFQQLLEFYAKNGTFDVPCPLAEEDDDAGGDGMGNSEEVRERYKFYKWATRLHNEYRAFEKGTSSKLNAERVEKLKNINFQFKGPKSRGRPSASNGNLVPKLSWEKRLQQLESFRADTGHLDIDHNYKHCSNLGGWAAEVSTLYRNWKDGTQHLSEDMINKFHQLIALGFRFNVLPYYENNRNWDDHYEIFMRYKEEHGDSARVPLKYKADLRLGKWVQVQRQQYKNWNEGKKSKLTQERIEKLERAGFEWEVAGPGSSVGDEEEEEEC